MGSTMMKTGGMQSVTSLEIIMESTTMQTASMQSTTGLDGIVRRCVMRSAVSTQNTTSLKNSGAMVHCA